MKFHETYGDRTYLKIEELLHIFTAFFPTMKTINIPDFRL